MKGGESEEERKMREKWKNDKSRNAVWNWKGEKPGV